MEQSPSLRKNRYFFQSSDGVNENGIANITEVEGHLESGKSLLVNMGDFLSKTFQKK